MIPRCLLFAAFAAGATAFGSTPMDHGHGHHGGDGHANMDGGGCVCGNYPLFMQMGADMHEMCFSYGGGMTTIFYMPNSGSMHAMGGDTSCAEAVAHHGLTDYTDHLGEGADCSAVNTGC